MKKPKTITCLALALLIPNLAQAQEAMLSADESAAIDAVIDPFLQGLSGESSRQALMEIMGTSTSGGLSSEQADSVTAKIDGTLETYGPVQRCVMFDQQLRSPLLVQRRYMCQHRAGLSHWTFNLFRLPDRWATQHLAFSTEVEELFHSPVVSANGDDAQ